MFYREVQDFEELGLPVLQEESTLVERKTPRYTSVRVPVRLFKVSEGFMGRFWYVHLETTSQLDNDWKVVRCVSGEGTPLQIMD